MISLLYDHLSQSSLFLLFIEHILLITILTNKVVDILIFLYHTVIVIPLFASLTLHVFDVRVVRVLAVTITFAPFSDVRREFLFLHVVGCASKVYGVFCETEDVVFVKC